MPPPLPRELMEQIFGDERLDKRTLARCCRISRDYLDFVRRRLYSHIAILYTVGITDAFQDTEYVYEDHSVALLLALGRYPHLGRLVQSAVFRMAAVDDVSFISMTELQAVHAVVAACPNLCRLGCPRFAEAALYDYLEEILNPPCTVVDLGYPQSGMWRVLELHQSIIQHLVFLNSELPWSADAPPPTGTLPSLRLRSLIILPPSLMGAHSNRNADAFFRALTAASQASLDWLRMMFDPKVLRDFSMFTSLRNLELVLQGDEDLGPLISSLKTISGLTSLSLFTQLSDAQRDNLLQPSGLASVLPSSLQALDLPAGFLPDHLATFLHQLRHIPPLRVVSFQRPYQPLRLRVLSEEPSPSPEPPEPDYTAVAQQYAARNLHLLERPDPFERESNYYFRRL